MADPAGTSAPIILVPGFWLGAWAWDEVASVLREEGNDVTAITLPGLESADADRSNITFDDHVDAIVDAVNAAPAPVVLAVHSASGFSGYAASDRVPEKIAAMVYVDTAPGIGPLDPEFEGDEKPMVWKDIEARHPQHSDRHRVHCRAAPDVRAGASGMVVPRRHPRAPQRDLG